MSAVMITGDGFDLQSITAGKTDTKPGLGLFPEAIVDQHFLKRQRVNRLISAVLDHPDLVGDRHRRDDRDLRDRAGRSRCSARAACW